MRKYVSDLKVVSVSRINDKYVLIKLTQDAPLPDMLPGQFVEVRVDGSPSTFLRRPISINFVDREKNQLWLLVAAIGEGTRHLAGLRSGDVLNCMYPLGRGFTMHVERGEKLLLVGGGVGVAPMLFLGERLKHDGYEPVFLLGARSKGDLLLLDEFGKYGRVCVTTEDATAGERGFVTNHSVLDELRFDRIYTCGPKPMMLAVAKYAKQNDIKCEVSLENKMACGLGACLCCVEKTTNGNVCVCTEGPVFDINDLKWQI